MQNHYMNDQAYLAIFFKLSQKYTHYERTVFTIFDMFGMLGGIFELFSMIGLLLVSTVSIKIFNNSILSSLYQVKNQNTNPSRVHPERTADSAIRYEK